MKKLGLIGLVIVLLSPVVSASTWSGWYASQRQASSAALAGCRAYYRAPCVIKYCQVTDSYNKRWRCKADRMKSQRWDRGRGYDRGRDDRGRRYDRSRDDPGRVYDRGRDDPGRYY